VSYKSLVAGVDCGELPVRLSPPPSGIGVQQQHFPVLSDA